MISESRIAQQFGNGAHIIVPKSFIGKRIIIQSVPFTFETIRSAVLEILQPYLPNIIGVYLYGSYARNEQTIDSDIDILVVTNKKCTIPKKEGSFSIVSITLDELENTIGHNIILILPIVREAKTIVNPLLLTQYRNIPLSKKNTRTFLLETTNVLSVVKKGVQLHFDIGSLVYSLLLRIRALYIMKCLLQNTVYTKMGLFSFLKKEGLQKEVIILLYSIYTKEREGEQVQSDAITKKDILILIGVVEKLLKKVRRSLK